MTVRGRVSASAFAVLALTTSSNSVGCWTGRSAGFAPARIRAAYTPRGVVHEPEARSVADQAAGRGELAERVDGRDPVAGRQPGHLLPARVVERIRADHAGGDVALAHGRERAVQIAVARRLQHVHLHVDRLRGGGGFFPVGLGDRRAGCWSRFNQRGQKFARPRRAAQRQPDRSAVCLDGDFET